MMATPRNFAIFGVSISNCFLSGILTGRLSGEIRVIAISTARIIIKVSAILLRKAISAIRIFSKAGKVPQKIKSEP